MYSCPQERREKEVKNIYRERGKNEVYLGSILGLKQICSCANIGVKPLKKVIFLEK